MPVVRHCRDRGLYGEVYCVKPKVTANQAQLGGGGRKLCLLLSAMGHLHFFVNRLLHGLGDGLWGICRGVSAIERRIGHGAHCKCTNDYSS